MIGVIIGAVASIVLLTFLSKDTKAVQQHKQQQTKVQQEKEAEQKKLIQQRQQLMNDPKVEQSRIQRQKEIREKMFKGLSESQRKSLQDYIKEQRSKGKEESQIMKQAGSTALLFFLLMVVVLFCIIVGVWVLFSGDLNKIEDAFGNLKEAGFNFLKWSFPKLSNALDANEL